MKKSIFKGCATALVTPMLKNGDVNYECLKSLVETQIESGIDALVICGTTGEKSTLEYDEHLKVIETAIKVCGGRVPIIAGTGSNDTAHSVKLCLDAEKLGADALLMVTPYYNKTSQIGLIEHYNHIADRVTKPIILYNVPSRTGMNITPETYKQLSKHKNIVAVKEASGNISQIAKIKYFCGDDLDIYSGNDDQTIPILALGGIGLISVASNIIPRVMCEICHEYLNGNTKYASELQNRYLGLLNALFYDVNPIPVKSAMNMLGYNVGNCRLPLCEIDKGALDLLKAKLTECNLM